MLEYCPAADAGALCGNAESGSGGLSVERSKAGDVSARRSRAAGLRRTTLAAIQV